MFYIFYDTSNKTNDPISTSYEHWQNIMSYISPLRFLSNYKKFWIAKMLIFVDFVCKVDTRNQMSIEVQNVIDILSIYKWQWIKVALKLWFSLNQWRWKSQFKTSIPTLHIVIIPHSWLNVIRVMTVLKTGCLFRYFHYLMQGNNTRKQDFD